MDQFEGKTAVVTGAASGIGLGMTEALTARGMKVVMADVQQASLEAEAERLTRENKDVLPRLADVSKQEDVDALLAAATDASGPVHVLCNNAGVGGAPGPIWATPPDAWDWVMGINLNGVMHGLRAFVPHMLDHGEPSHIVNTSSIAGLMTGGGNVYGVSKHAVTRISEGLYFDLAERNANIGVTCLCPGIINTNIVGSSPRPPGAPPREAPSDPAVAERMASFRRYFAEQGMDPRVVGELVANAIRDNAFYLFTQDEFAAGIKSRFDQINAVANPVLPPPLPETLANDPKV